MPILLLIIYPYAIWSGIYSTFAQAMNSSTPDVGEAAVVRIESD